MLVTKERLVQYVNWNSQETRYISVTLGSTLNDVLSHSNPAQTSQRISLLIIFNNVLPTTLKIFEALFRPHNYNILRVSATTKRRSPRVRLRLQSVFILLLNTTHGSRWTSSLDPIKKFFATSGLLAERPWKFHGRLWKNKLREKHTQHQYQFWKYG
jgi:hypothetical protein